MITYDKTQNGLLRANFADRNHNACSVQESSLAEEACLWLGMNEAHASIMAVDAEALGMDTKGQDWGWVPYPIPEQVLIPTRMHLTQEQVAALLPILQHFAATGELLAPAEDADA